ncbi:hypothetical protein [Streptomyces pseudovenezuelae]|uniref:hypothetical protein n=1 Tax=Streptomyces pseudovenezuelae TaxID=67350 RepID=UPI002E374773|nr:hypothetical protein [Streptomyces pseudovenezuelae]
MTVAKEPPRYAADPDGVIREAVLCAEPYLDPGIVAAAVGEVAPIARAVADWPGAFRRPLTC